MKAVVSGFALLAFLAASTLPMQSYAQTSSSPTMAPDGSGAAPSTKKSKGSSKSHSKKKSKKSSTHASAGKPQHHSMNTTKRSRHSAS